MTPDLITALQNHGQQHKGTDLGGLLQWAALHIQAQAVINDWDSCGRSIQISQLEKSIENLRKILNGK